jgi:glutamine synthetase
VTAVDHTAAGFVTRHAPFDERAIGAVQQAERVIDEQGIDLIRLAFADTHGVLRGKTVSKAAYEAALVDGYRVPATLVAKDTAHRTVYPVFRGTSGSTPRAVAEVGDVVLVPDPTTFRMLPWTTRTGWVLCDVHEIDGAPSPYSTRGVLRRVLDDLADHGYDLTAGVELEFYVFRLEDAHLHPEHSTQPAAPPTVSLVNHGYQLMTEQRLDQLDDVVRLLADTANALDLPLRSVEMEFGPSQLEVTFAPLPAMQAADAVTLFRSAVKQVCRRQGYHATFMSRPHLPNLFSSGWHLHQSLTSRVDGSNAFVPAHGEGDGPLSALGRDFLGGILAHAPAAAVFTTPTVNGYKRFQPFSLAPERVCWGEDNRGALARVIGGPGDPATRIENRAGEPAANPYLYLASQVVSGLDGMERGLDPGPPTSEPYNDLADRLPRHLLEALDALAADAPFRAKIGEVFTDHLVATKRSELDRYLGAVSDWEQREYFDLF